MRTTPHDTIAQRALALAETGRHQEAAALFARHLAADPTDTMSWSLLAHCRRELGDPEGALDATDQGLRYDPTDAYVWRIRALTLLTLERHADAVDAAAEAVRLAPGGWATHNAHARALATVPGGLPAARAAALRSTELAPQEPQAHFTLGYVAQASGDHQTAARSYRTVLRLNPQHAEARNNLGTLKLNGRRNRGQFGAAQDFAASLATDPQSSAAQHNVLVVALRVLTTARRLTVWCLLGAPALRWYLGGARLDGPAPSAALQPRLAALAAIALVWACWAWSTRRRLPRALRDPMWAMLLRDRRFATSAFGILVAMLGAIAALTLPQLSTVELAAIFLGGLVPLSLTPKTGGRKTQ
ncbi:tetratricopeptide repeat protein [Streptomyces sp. NPDC005303]|uniref:tetratricopeptide repeat protein n=1 Tax=Streptomyces sp. NPDC005303 TaxID=3155713 RepID=UPI0033A3DCD3